MLKIQNKLNNKFLKFVKYVLLFIYPLDSHDTKFLKSIKLFLIPLKASATFLSSSISYVISLTYTFGIMLTN